MSVRITESRLPSGFAASDLGQSSSNGDIHLISYLSSPLAKLRIQTYNVFVTNAAAVATYNWTINDNGTITNPTTTVGFLEYTPQNTGSLSVSVELKNGPQASVGIVTLQQNVVALNTALETLIDQQDTNTPVAGHPATSREAINDLRMYVDAMLSPGTDALFNKLLLSIGYASALLTPQLLRNTLIENFAATINNNVNADLSEAMEKGIGICKVRPQELAMFLNPSGTNNPYIPFTAKPITEPGATTKSEAIKTTFNALSQNDKIDLFNLLRFPKSNYRMAKLIIEKLKAKYFSYSTISKILADKNNAAKLIIQYFAGPLESDKSNLQTGPSVFNLMQQGVWNIKALPLAGAAPASGSPAAVPPLGAPEEVPELTFIAKPKQTDNGFIRQAYLYHNSFGLAPVYVVSFEDLVAKLSQQNTPVKRLRIVSHFTYDPAGLTPSGMNMSFFTPITPEQSGGITPAFTIKEYFKYGVSDDEGLAAVAVESIKSENAHLLDPETIIQVDSNQPNATMEKLMIVILMQLRKNSPDLLVPFALHGPASELNGQFGEFFHYCCDLFFVSHTKMVFAATGKPVVKPVGPIALAAIKNFIGTQITAAAKPLVDAKAGAQNKAKLQSALDNLQAAIITLAPATFPFPNPDFGAYDVMLDEELLQKHTTFLSNLATVKNRFSSSSFVDIRGCRVGLEPNFMNAIKEFFGNPGNLPTVSAPDWFQSFPFIRFNLAVGEQGIDDAFNIGLPVYTNLDVQREYSTWSGRLGIPSHISFWQHLANGDAFDFLTFTWKDNIPGLAIPAVKATNFNALTFSAALTRLGEIFNISASVPAPATMQTFESQVLPQLASLKSAADSIAVMTANTPVSDLNSVNSIVQQVSTALAQSLPAAPTPMTYTYLTNSVQSLKFYVASKLNVMAFLQAFKDKLTAPTAGLRYLLSIGLPLPVQSGETEGKVTLCMLDILKDDAVKSWVNTKWAAVTPGAAAFKSLTFTWNEASHIIQNSPDPNDYNLTSLGSVLQTPGLSSNHELTEFSINPTYEYQSHIKSTN